jgi:hypothetical protein
MKEEVLAVQQREHIVRKIKKITAEHSITKSVTLLNFTAPTHDLPYSFLSWKIKLSFVNSFFTNSNGNIANSMIMCLV